VIPTTLTCTGSSVVDGHWIKLIRNTVTMVQPLLVLYLTYYTCPYWAVRWHLRFTIRISTNWHANSFIHFRSTLPRSLPLGPKKPKKGKNKIKLAVW